MQRELRRYENRLVVIGTGVACIGLWSLIRVMLSLFLESWIMDMMKEEAESEGLLGEVIMAVLVLLVVTMTVGAHLFIGLSARSEGFGKHSGWLYLVVTILTIVTYVYGMWDGINTFDEYYSDPFEGVISLLIDASVVTTMAEMSHAAIRVKLYRRKLKMMEAA